MRREESTAKQGGSANTQAMVALESHYQFMLWLVPTLEKFPRSQKYLLGDRIQTAACTLLDKLIEATYTKERDGLLKLANIEVEKATTQCHAIPA